MVRWAEKNGETMSHEQRKLLATWIFDSFTFSLGRALEMAASEGAQTATAVSNLKTFRDHFDGRRLSQLDEAGFVARWVPDQVRQVFTPLQDVIATLAGAFPDLKTAPDPMRHLPAASATEDACVGYEQLCAALADYLVHVRLVYWRKHREQIRAQAKAEADVVDANARFADGLRSFYEYARRMSKGNDDILGALVEEFVRNRIAESVRPLEVSSGGIYGLPYMYQLDCIIWDRRVAPPAIEAGSVAIVAPNAARAVVEVKASCDSSLAKFVDRILALEAQGSVLQDVFGTALYTRNIGVVVWTDFDVDRFAAIAGNCVIPLFFRREKTLEPNAGAIQSFLEFLSAWGRS